MKKGAKAAFLFRLEAVYRIKRFSSQKKQPKARAANGFTMSEALMALLTGVFIAGICLGFARILNHALDIRPDDQEQFAILQIREMITAARSAKAEEGGLLLTESTREEKLVKDKNRLVKQPGYEILMENLEDVYFEIKDSQIWLTYKKGGKERTFQVG